MRHPSEGSGLSKARPCSEEGDALMMLCAAVLGEQWADTVREEGAESDSVTL